MKKIHIIFQLCLVLLCFSCKKEYAVKEPNLAITVEKNTFKVGDTIRFNFDGEADFISFYSGKIGSDYDFHAKDRVYEANTVLSFRSAKYAGANPDCCTLKYSTDFNGTYDRASIRSATWTDISDRFFIPGIVGTAATFSDSGVKDIADLFPATNKPIYFGWFFKTAANSQRTQFQVAEFKIQGIVLQNPALSGVKYDFVDFNFKMVLGEGFDGVTASLPNVNATRMLWTGVFNNDTFKEGWAVSGPINKSSQVNLGLDKPVVIKIVSDPESASYRYVYDEPGEYTATFVVANSSVYGRKEVVKQLKFTITP